MSTTENPPPRPPALNGLTSVEVSVDPLIPKTSENVELKNAEQRPPSAPKTSRPPSGKRHSRAAVAPMDDSSSPQQPPPTYASTYASTSVASTLQPATASGSVPNPHVSSVVVVPAAHLESDPMMAEPPDDRCCCLRFFGFPLPVFFIIGNEFCERFSFYGMRAILVLFFTTRSPAGLNMDDSTATVIYHVFTMLVYFTPLLGGIVADTWLGKFWTIVSLSLVYAIGNLVVSVTSFPLPALTAGAMIGLVLIALGSGGIKPCVSAFGADQFGSSPRDQRQLSRFFSIFYFTINLGSLFSYIITPILRANVKCFGTDNCYPLAFGVPAFLMVIAIIVFVSGYCLYKKNPPKGNVLVKVFGVIIRAFVNWIKNKPGIKEGFLNRASDKYDEQLIHDVRVVLRVLLLFLPVPVFWALFDQQGSRWTLQATQMDFSFIQPDQVRVLNPLLVLILIPIFDSIIYPLLAKCNLLTNKRLPQRMVVGGIFAVGAFVVAAFVQLAIDPTQPRVVDAAKFRLLSGNLLPRGYNLSLEVESTSNSVPFLGTIDRDIDLKMKQLNYRLTSGSTSAPMSMSIVLNNIGELGKSNEDFPDNSNPLNVDLVISLPAWNISGSETYRLVISRACKPMCKLYAKIFNVITKKADNGNSYVRFVSVRGDTEDPTTNYTVEVMHDASDDLVTRGSFRLPGEVLASSTSVPIERNWLNFKLRKQDGGELAAYRRAYQILNGAGLTLVLSETAEERLKVYELEDMPSNTVSIFLQIPQYVLITLGEVLFSVSGLEFAYQQAPTSMKAFLTACWQLTTAFGNLIIIIIAEFRIPNQALEFVIFAALMLVDIIVFAVIAFFYKAKDESAPAPDMNTPSGVDSKALEMTQSSKQDKVKQDE